VQTALLSPRQIAPHGGELCERLVSKEESPQLEYEAQTLPRISIGRRTLSDLRLLGNGALSPLKGFMTRAEYERVIHEMRLPNGLVWSIPITLQIGALEASELKAANRVALTYQGRTVAVMEIAEVYQPDRTEEALSVYGVDDPRHPGVNALYEQGEFYVGGDVKVLDLLLSEEGKLAEYCLSPRQTRELFAARKWQRVVAFQTRNPIHRAHEYLQKCALETVDGLLIHPLIGETKADDIDAATRFRCYEEIVTGYFPQEKVLLGAFPASMRYAGPKEAIFHAICRKNYGCTHFIVGRDHAGVGSYYGTYDAQLIFDRFDPAELGIEPIRFEHAFYCRICRGMATSKTCPHEAAHHVVLSGTKVREMLGKGEAPPPEFTRPDVAKILISASRKELNGRAAPRKGRSRRR